MSWWHKRKRPPVVKPPGLTERDLQTALTVGEENMLWRAVQQCIEVQQHQALVEVMDPDNQSRPALLHYYAGAAAHLQTLGDFLREQREKGLAAKLDDDTQD